MILNAPVSNGYFYIWNEYFNDLPSEKTMDASFTPTVNCFNLFSTGIRWKLNLDKIQPHLTQRVSQISHYQLQIKFGSENLVSYNFTVKLLKLWTFSQQNVVPRKLSSLQKNFKDTPEDLYLFSSLILRCQFLSNVQLIYYIYLHCQYSIIISKHHFFSSFTL